MAFRNPLTSIPASGIIGQIQGSQLAADSIDGKVITGANIRTAATGNRVELDGTSFWDRVLFYTGDAGETVPPNINGGVDGGDGSLRLELRSGQRTLADPAILNLSTRPDSSTWAALTANSGGVGPFAWSPTGTKINTITYRPSTRGRFAAASDASGNCVIPHGLGQIPAAWFANLAAGNTAAVNQLAKIVATTADANNIVFNIVRSDTGVPLVGTIYFYWHATQ